MESKSVGITHHTSRTRGTWTDDHGTPLEVVGLVKEMFNFIDIDLASSYKHNKVVEAEHFYTKACSPPDVVPLLKVEEVVFCNPPGPCKNVSKFFDIWQNCLRRGGVGAFLIYNIDHWRILQPQLDLWCVILRRRLKFTGAKHQANFSSVLVTSKRPPSGWGHIVHWGP